MNFSKYKNLCFQVLLLNQLFMIDLYRPINILANENITVPSVDYIKKIPDSQFYILGPGDLLRIKVTEESLDLNTTFNIDGEGIANLKRLRRIYAAGLTISELTEILNKEYSKYVTEPDVQVVVLQHRPLKIYIDGEVEEPGLHVLPGGYDRLSLLDSYKAKENKIDVNKVPSPTASIVNNKDFFNDNILFPTLIDAIRASGGVTTNADLTNIKITRINSISNGSGKIKTNVNLLETLNLKDTSNNIRILDGDTILVSRSSSPVGSQISKAIKSNLNPKFITVYVGGKVEKQGMLNIRKNAVLAEAIAFSGGTKGLGGPISFLRYNNEGKVDQRKFTLRRYANKGSYQNPYLKDGDVIFVGKSSLNVATEVITEVTRPITGIFSTWALYKTVTGN